MSNPSRPQGAASKTSPLTRRGLACLFVAGATLAATRGWAEAIVTDEAGLVTEAVQIDSAGQAVPGYLARPARGGPFPAVIVVSEVYGLNDYIRDICRRFAKLGYVALAPDFFVRAGAPAALSDPAAIMRIVQATPDRQVLADIGAAVAFLKARDEVIGDRLAITGFGWGGTMVWLACETFSDFRAGVAWYGPLGPAAGAPADPSRLWPIQNVASLRAPVLGLYAGGDPDTAAVPAMRQALDAARQSGTEIIIYPDAQAGFDADYRSSYSPADAQDGWMRLLAHFAINGAVSRHDTPNRPHVKARAKAKVKRSRRSTRPHRARRRRGRKG
jgi:carboxymethylenebutenolidase